MTRDEAITWLKEMKDTIELYNDLSHSYTFDKYPQAIDMAIYALNREEKWLDDFANNVSNDTRSRNYESDTEVRLAVVNRYKRRVVLFDPFGEEEYLPTEPSRLTISKEEAEKLMIKPQEPNFIPQTKDCTDFLCWLLEEIMDEENWEMNAVANGEIIARKLKKLGLLEVKDGYYVRTPMYETLDAEPKRGEWKYLHGSIGSYMTMSCPFCGETFNDVAEWKYHYCPNCGAYMGDK